MFTQILKFLATNPFFAAGNLIWEVMMNVVFGVMNTTPQGFSGRAWNYVTGTVYPVTLAVGVTLLNLFCLAGFFRQASNLKQNLTMEILIEQGIRLVAANVLMQSGLSIITGLFQSAAAFSGIFSIGQLTVLPEDMDAGATLFGVLFGILYFLVCVVCAFMIFFAVYGRFLQLYVIVVCAPLALSTIAGGNGIDRTGYAYIRTLVGKTFEIVVIALFLVVGMKMCQSIDWGDLDGFGEWFDGAAQCFQSMVTMVLMAASVKGADSFMRRVFGL